MAKHLALLCLMLSLSACGATRPRQAPLPTADIQLAQAPRAPIAPFLASQSPTPIQQPAATMLPSTTPATGGPTATLSPNPADQYRAWIDEARATHPYADPPEAMWELMICESSGNAAAIAGQYYGLFQYDSATWAGEWNPYRDQPILDARAQIFATAKAWHDGNQRWWGCYRG